MKQIKDVQEVAGIADPLIWVEAEDVFVARGFAYRVSAAPAPPDDSETVLGTSPGGSVVVLSSRSPAELGVAPGWAAAEPLLGLEQGGRVEDAVVVLCHGGNEFTFAQPARH